MRKNNLLIVGGGTGGHIIPGIALYDEFHRMGINTYFLASKRDVRFSPIKDIPPKHLLLYSAASFTRNIIKFPFFILKFFWSLFTARRLLRKLNITAVIGMGGYVSAPVLIMASRMKIAIYLCEQNSIPGKVTKFFAKWARAIFTTFDVTKEYFNNGVQVIHAGNPIRKKVFSALSKEMAKSSFNLTHCKKVILIIGGSQGALKINQLILGIKKKYPEEFNSIGVIWSTGSFSYKEFSEKISNDIEKGSIFLSSFIDDVGRAYMASDAAISRAGAGVMMELAAMGIPQILIPYPHAALDHQEKNAEEFVKAGAAIKFSDHEATPEIVGPELFSLLDNTTRLKRMSRNGMSVSRQDAASFIVNKVIEFMKVK